MQEYPPDELCVGAVGENCNSQVPTSPCETDPEDPEPDEPELEPEPEEPEPDEEADCSFGAITQSQSGGISSEAA